MVLDLRWRLRLGAIAAAFATGGIVSAQGLAPNPLPALQQSVSQRTAEWNTLAADLEQRVARLLPCDPKARAAIDEVSRDSDARSIVLTSYWTVASAQSKAQIEAIRGLLAQEEDRTGDGVMDSSQARGDADFVTALGNSLAASVAQLPALANPQKDLQAIAEQYRSLEKQSQERTASRGRLVEDLRDLLKASQARQAAIDERLKTVSVEGQRWSAYYTARQARAQVECALVNPGAAAPPPAIPRPAPPAKKQ
jgi:vacuolar-type H+-ATPase subunit I/STV1